jgi:excisionase family DNA binding protein
MTTDDRLMTADDVAGYLQVPLETIYKWRHKGSGPLAIKVGRHLRYRRSDVDVWLEGLATPRTGGRAA